MLKCLRPRFVYVETVLDHGGEPRWQMRIWLMRLLWRLKPFQPPSTT
jgi:hypothetical protein